jgi:hypothetical protein
LKEKKHKGKTNKQNNRNDRENLWIISIVKKISVSEMRIQDIGGWRIFSSNSRRF